MITDFPAPLFPPHSGAALGGGATNPTSGIKRKTTGAWHYSPSSHRLGWLILAAGISAGIHVSAFLFIGPSGPPQPKPIASDTPAITITLPDLKDLEDPEPSPTEGDAPVEASAFVPMLADLPQVPAPNDFVQKIDFNSLVDRPDMSAAKVLAVPDNINRGAAIRQSVGAVFNLADLDRVPEPLVRPPPIFPMQHRHDVMEATVRVQFIVDSNGQVVQPVVVDSTHSGFNTAAIEGVARWKFRPGIKNGRRVNTRMEVPIIFTVTDQ
jgi:protein TonB